MPERKYNKNMKHEHKGKSSERFLNKTIILNELAICPGQTVLDAGCGNGYMAKEFALQVTETGKVYAIDPDKFAIENLQLETKGSVIVPLEGDITRETPLEKSSIDLIYLSTVIHGFSGNQMKSFLEETKRLLRPEGRLAILEIKKETTPFGPPMDIRFSPEGLKQAIGLRPLALSEPGEYFYMQLFVNRNDM